MNHTHECPRCGDIWQCGLAICSIGIGEPYVCGSCADDLREEEKMLTNCRTREAQS